MANAQEILARMRTNPRDWAMQELKVLAERFGIEYRQHGASHVTFLHPRGLVTVPAARPIKPVYIRRFLDLINALEAPK